MRIVPDFTLTLVTGQTVLLKPVSAHCHTSCHESGLQGLPATWNSFVIFTMLSIELSSKCWELERVTHLFLVKERLSVTSWAKLQERTLLLS